METCERVAAARAVPNNLGDGWMTSSARDMVRMAAFAGFDMHEVVRRVAVGSNPNRTTNAATVGRILDEMYAETDPDVSNPAPAPLTTNETREDT